MKKFIKKNKYTVWKIMVYLKLLIVDNEGQKVISVRWIIKKEKYIYISQC